MLHGHFLDTGVSFSLDALRAIMREFEPASAEEAARIPPPEQLLALARQLLPHPRRPCWDRRSLPRGPSPILARLQQARCLSSPSPSQRRRAAVRPAAPKRGAGAGARCGRRWDRGGARSRGPGACSARLAESSRVHLPRAPSRCCRAPAPVRRSTGARRAARSRGCRASRAGALSSPSCDRLQSSRPPHLEKGLASGLPHLLAYGVAA